MADATVQPGAPPTEAADGGSLPSAEGQPAAERSATQPSPPAPLKLVVSCTPHEGGYRVALALGAEGCDPLFRAVVADGLVAALDEVPALLAEAEARWREQPRYPAARGRPATSRPAAPPRPAAGAAKPATPAARPTAAPPTKPPPAGQMGLFG